MAYFERDDTRNDGNPVLVLCNICNVNCGERSITTHKAKCRNKHANKFTKGELEVCSYDTGHIVPAGQMSVHLEFCNKRQRKFVEEFQLACTEATRTAPEEYKAPKPLEPRLDDNDAWNRDDSEAFVSKMSKLRLK